MKWIIQLSTILWYVLVVSQAGTILVTQLYCWLFFKPSGGASKAISNKLRQWVDSRYSWVPYCFNRKRYSSEAKAPNTALGGRTAEKAEVNIGDLPACHRLAVKSQSAVVGRTFSLPPCKPKAVSSRAYNRKTPLQGHGLTHLTYATSSGAQSLRYRWVKHIVPFISHGTRKGLP